MAEVWKDVPGYEGSYQVSSLGRVRSLDRLLSIPGYTASWKGLPPHERCARIQPVKGKMLRPGRRSSGHVTVALGRGNSQQVHALVLLAFVGPRPEGQEVLHLNHDPTDNRLENLRYGTRSENLKMDYARGVCRLPQTRRAT